MDTTPCCERCGAQLAGQAVGGLCANCLLKLALESAADPTVMEDAFPPPSAELIRVRNPTRTLKRGIEAWTGANEVFATIRLFKSTWENPTPGIVITTIDFVSSRTDYAPSLIAITLE